MSKFLESLEAKLQGLLEGTVDRVLSPGASRSLGNSLVQLINQKLREDTSHPGTVPDVIELHVSLERWDTWQAARDTLDEVAQEIENEWVSQGYFFQNHLKIRLIPSSDLAVEDIDIKTGFEEIQPEESTSPTILQIITRAPSPEALPKNACFIINGEEMVNLTSPLIKVGRRTSNDIVIKDPLVSRDHLQLRAQHGHYLLFDLSSTGGTYINNRQVKSATLKPGDVVRIGKTILIYNQDHAQHSTSTNILNVFPGDPK